MNLKKISIFSLIILIMIFIPTISKAAVFSQDHSIAGIYKAMQADSNGWITAPLRKSWRKMGHRKNGIRNINDS